MPRYAAAMDGDPGVGPCPGSRAIGMRATRPGERDSWIRKTPLPWQKLARERGRGAGARKPYGLCELQALRSPLSKPSLNSALPAEQTATLEKFTVSTNQPVAATLTSSASCQRNWTGEPA